MTLLNWPKRTGLETGFAKLKASARASADFRGHTLARFERREECRQGGRQRLTAGAKCTRCGLSAYVDTSPPPNGIDISGSAVAMDCEGPNSYTTEAV